MIRKIIYNLHFVITVVILLIWNVSCGDKDNLKIDPEAKTLSSNTRSFDLLDPGITRIDFINIIKGQSIPPHTQYVNVFNGAGLAVGDINNDGLQDLYITGNKVPNKLYLNKGNYVFEDITDHAGVSAENAWSNGAIFTDINNDGYEDIYVSCALYPSPERRENKLFINQGDNTFIEDAFSFGINDNGYSIQSGFFDYDQDGDNDLFVGNHPLNRKISFNAHMEKWRNPPMQYSDKLYRNDGNGKFTDVTKEAGISNYGWTLSFITSDFNNDGRPDIYIATDHAEPDRLFINNGEGTFTDHAKDYFKHISMSTMGSDFADINNDGHLDLFTAEMLSTNNFREKTQMAPMNAKGFNYRVKHGYQHQYMRNMLQLSTGKNSYSEIAQLSGIERSDWSWSTLFFDFDNDFDEDLFIANGYYFDLLDKDFRNKYAKLVQNAKSAQEESSVMKGVYEMAPSTPIINKFYSNNGDLTFKDVSTETGTGYESFSSGAVYVDLNNDGKLDIVTNNIDQPVFVFKNINNQDHDFVTIKLEQYLNSDPIGSRVIIKFKDGSSKTKDLIRARGYASAISSLLHFGLGTNKIIDEVIVKWPNGMIQSFENVQMNQTNILKYKASLKGSVNKNITAKIFNKTNIDLGIHRENKFDDYGIQVLLPHRMSTLGPIASTGDINGDGYEDVFIGGSRGQSGRVLLNKQGQSFEELDVPVLTSHKGYEDMGSALFDIDNDGDLDLYVSSGGYEYPNGHSYYQDRFYLNEKGNFIKTNNRIPSLHISSGRVSVSDYNNDGFKDLFVAGRQNPHNYPKPTSSYILQNDGSGRLVDVTHDICPDLSDIGMITEGKWADINGDGAVDLILTGEWSAIHLFINEDGILIDRSMEYNLNSKISWWNTIKVIDIDSDDDLDLVVGNLGLNYKYQGNDEKPFHIYSNDFDTSGTTDIVLGYYFNDDILYPVRGKQCSSEQMPSISEKFENYDDFASSSLLDIYGKVLDSGIHYQANEFRSGVFVNDSGIFNFVPFPNYAQMAPINGIVSGDYNDDGHIDLVVGGNKYESEIETGRADAGRGLLLLGQGDGHFNYVDAFTSGLLAEGDVKDVIQIDMKKESLLIFLRNNNSHLTYSIKK